MLLTAIIIYYLRIDTDSKQRQGKILGVKTVFDITRCYTVRRFILQQDSYATYYHFCTSTLRLQSIYLDTAEVWPLQESFYRSQIDRFRY